MSKENDEKKNVNPKDIFIINGHITIARTFNEIYDKTGWGYDSVRQFIDACVVEGLLIQAWSEEKQCSKYIPTQKFFTYKQPEVLRSERTN